MKIKTFTDDSRDTLTVSTVDQPGSEVWLSADSGSKSVLLVFLPEEARALAAYLTEVTQ